MRIRYLIQRPFKPAIPLQPFCMAMTVVFALVCAGDVRSAVADDGPRPGPWEARVLEIFFEDALAEVQTSVDDASAEGVDDRGDRDPADIVAETIGAMPTFSRDDEGSNETGTVADHAATETGWADLVSGETLEEEIKELSVAVGQGTRSNGAVRRGRLEVIRWYGELAVLFGVIAEYEGDVRWAEDAAAMRDAIAAAGRALADEEEEGPKLVRDVGAALRDVVAGNGYVGEVTSNGTWAELTERSVLMQRFELGMEQRIAAWTADAAAFRRNRGALAREAAIWGVLGRVIGTEGFDYADDEDFLAFVERFIAGADAVQAATEANDLDGAQSGVTQLRQSCAACHADYRG